MKSIATSILSPYLLTAAFLASPSLALALTGGPDGGGYQFEDSDEPGGPAPNWIDIVGIGSDAAIGDGDSLVVPLPFTFTYYGVQYDEVTIDDDGVLLLGATSSLSFSNGCLPYDNYTGDNAFIAAVWDDLDPEGAGAVGVYYATLGQPGNLRFVVSFINVPHWNTTSFYDAQIVLFEGLDEIQLQYGSVDEVDPNYGFGASATVGIQGDSSTGLEVSCNGTALTSDYAIRFWQDCTDLDGDGVTTCDGDCDDGDPAVLPGAVEICDGVDNDCQGGVDDGLRSYSATDSDEPNGPVFGWIDISATGTDAGLTDEGEANVAVPFPFEFYGSVVDELTVGANGAILLEGNQGLSFTNPCLPGDNTSGGDVLLAPLWDDLDPGDGAAGGVFHEVIGAAPDRQLVIQYQDIPRYGTQAFFTFQVVLSEGSSDVLFQYLSLDAADPTYGMGASASVGVQASATDGISYACNDGSALHDQLAIRFEDTSFIDLDGDGLSSCDGDCDDADADTFPGAPELCDTQDNDCDGQLPIDEADVDGDGVGVCDGDCDDEDPAAYPGADEVCDGIDNDCDPGTDEEADIDGDGASICDGDCDESDPDLFPGNPELQDLVDNDCDGVADEDFLLPGDVVVTEFMNDPAATSDDAGEWFEVLNLAPFDINLRGWVVADTGGEADVIDDDVILPAGAFALLAAEDDPAVNGGLPAVDWAYAGFNLYVFSADAIVLSADGVEIDRVVYSTDWAYDEGFSAYLDPDFYDMTANDEIAAWCTTPEDVAYDFGGGPGDYGTPAADNPAGLCCVDDDGDGWTTCGGDCDDADAQVNPGMLDICDGGVDNDCDWGTDENLDLDGDGLSACDGDCDDGDASSFPGAPETCDEGDCDDGDSGMYPEDLDGDGETPCEGDCDDGDASLNGDDADGDGVSTCDGDCDDSDPTAMPGNPEDCEDGVDNDCDGDTDADDSDCESGDDDDATGDDDSAGDDDDDDDDDDDAPGDCKCSQTADPSAGAGLALLGLIGIVLIRRRG